MRNRLSRGAPDDVAALPNLVKAFAGGARAEGVSAERMLIMLKHVLGSAEEFARATEHRDGRRDDLVRLAIDTYYGDH
ncbi:MAG TPA: hypothetical protein VF041_18105 [Gemmatimonadaceae bacterium]